MHGVRVRAVSSLLLALLLSFEASLAGFTGYHGAQLVRTSGGADGLWSVNVIGPTNTSDYGIDDSPALVRSTVAGKRYTFTAWVKGTSGRCDIQLREYLGSTKIGATVLSPVMVLSGPWQKVSASIVAGRNTSQLDFQVRMQSTGRAPSFQVDAIAVDTGAVAPPPPPPPPPPVVQRWIEFDVPAWGWAGANTCEGQTVTIRDSVDVHLIWFGPSRGSTRRKYLPGVGSIAAPTATGTYQFFHYFAYKGITSCEVMASTVTIPAPPGPALYGRP